MKRDTFQRVYQFHRDYAVVYGYSPTNAEVTSTLHLSNRDYYAARRWLAERRFLSAEPHRKRPVRLNVRHCTCGAEITPQNAILDTSRGRIFVRGKCYTCFYAAHNLRDRLWRERNPGYVARRVRRQRQQQSAASGTARRAEEGT